MLGIDARESIYALPRAIGMDHEVMRVFQNIGVADDLAGVVAEYRDSVYRAADGALLRHFTSPPPPYRLGWPAYLTFIQPELEKTLRAKANACECIMLRTGVEAIGLTRPVAPRLTLRDTSTGEIAALDARFVVGCDGGASFVRRSLEIKFEDLIFDQPWLVVDVILGDAAIDLPETNVQYCHPARPHTFVVCPGRLRRWEFMLLPGETADEVNRPERVWTLLSPWIKPSEAEIWRSATYRFHALVAEKWRVGNVFLAGDACHMTPPFLAQGMVQGIKDAANLGWKLAYVLKGAPDALLDSYEQERRPLVHKVISITKELGEVICEIDEEKAKTRDEKLKSLVLQGKGTQVRQELFPPICEGLIARNAAGEPMPGAGECCPQPHVRVDDRWVRLDDLAGSGFALLTCGFTISQSNRERGNQFGIIVHEFSAEGLTEEDGVLGDWLSSVNARAVLIRPDHVVFGVAFDDEGLGELFEQLEQGLRLL
ncbi:2-polyprenyl-6-methoxyphenol hydroxylase-related FAD-dependent oxidoreductase (plasmid) [Sinorhizobium sojae CCBAU 05684]|uniref:2-polyprenyl-6-methoxyphenol hydroxylase-related FAD-dependent oxidoreductase n=2 Tax=Sinorhizobium sojae TaxID=716925 RepID=A0A249PLP5_9HYPH|nr:2-polyprenyl-6-methoxyphenol hydroxylase-related FAD-dependent oxidoreductase [Sinorhizobium sojae CCBAU 05684]